MNSNGVPGGRESSLQTIPGDHHRLVVTSITKRFRTSATRSEVIALDDVSVTVEPGSFTVLLGPSGCGKSTLLRIMAGLVAPTSGEIFVGGQEMWSEGRPDKHVALESAMVFQEANLFPWMTAEQNIALPLKLRGVRKADRLERARHLCEVVGISGFEKSWSRQLSGGMQQRVAIARALSYEPKILFMDEPFGALDALTRDLMNLELLRIWRESGATVVLVTHSISEAVFLADRVVLMSPRPGKIVSTTEIPFPRPRSIELQRTDDFQRIVQELHRGLGAE